MQHEQLDLKGSLMFSTRLALVRLLQAVCVHTRNLAVHYPHTGPKYVNPTIEVDICCM